MSRLLQYLLWTFSVILLAVACIFVSRKIDSLASVQEEQIKELGTQIRRVELQVEQQGRLFENSAMLKRLAELTASNKRLEDQLEQQSALLGRTVGTVLPVKIPAGIMEELSALESRTKDSKLWPSSKAEAAEYADRASKAIAQVPAWAEADHLTQLNAIRWAALAFQLLQSSESSSAEELQAHADSLGEAASIAPDEIPSALHQEVLAKSEKVENLARQKAKHEALAAAEDALNKKVDLLSLVVLDEKLRTLGDDREIQATLGRVRSEIGRREIAQKVEEYAQRFEAIQSHLIDRPSLYEQAISVLRTDISMTRVAHLLDDSPLPEALEALNSKLESAISDYQRSAKKMEEKKYADAFRAYQVWTLSQIKAFDEAVDAAFTKAKENSRIYGETWTDAEYDSVKSAIVKHLLPVNPALLDLPVNERYQKAFQRGWTKLDVEDRNDQTYVAEQSVLIEKKSLSSFEDQ